jgi:hypothetical protein
MARTQILKSAWDEMAQVLTYTIKDRPELQPIVISVSEFPDEIKVCGLLHGFDQKFRDKVAGKAKDTDPTSFYRVFAQSTQDLVSQMSQGDWNSRAEGGGTPGAGLTVEAIARNKGMDIAKVQAWYAAQTDAVKTGLRKVPAIMATMATIRAERAAARPKPAPAADVVGALDGLV